MEMFFKPSEAAKFLGVSKITIKRWKKDGKLVPDIVDSTGHFFYAQSQLLNLKNGIITEKTVSQTVMIPFQMIPFQMIPFQMIPFQMIPF